MYIPLYYLNIIAYILSVFLLYRSKNLLIDFLSSPKIIGMIGLQYSSNIVTFLRDKVFHIEDNFGKHHYHNVRCFDEYTNTPLEGTNNGAKHSTLGVNGNMTLPTSSVNMVLQDEDKLQANKKQLNDDMHKRRLCDLDDDALKYVSKKAVGQLSLQVKALENYASVRNDEKTWNVLRSTSRRDDLRDIILPVFERIRCVTWNIDQTMSCDCRYLNRWGMPCRHIAHVLQL